MKRAANQWGIGRVLYSMDTVWVNVEKKGKSFIIKPTERGKLDARYLDTLRSLGLTPAKACGNFPHSHGMIKTVKKEQAPPTGGACFFCLIILNICRREYHDPNQNDS